MRGATERDHAYVHGLAMRRGRFHLQAMLPRMLLATLAAGIAGTLANAVAAAAIVNPELLSLALVPGRYVVAVLVALAIPLCLAVLRERLALWAALALLALSPSLLAKLVFAAAAPWHLVLLLNGLYAAVALLTYMLCAGSIPSRFSQLTPSKR